MAFVLGEVIVCLESPVWVLLTILILIIIIIRKFNNKLLVVIFISFFFGMALAHIKTNLIIVENEIIQSSEIKYCGSVENRQIKKEKFYYYIDNIIIISEEDLKVQIGNFIEIRGSYYPFSENTNPGCFNEKAYYNSLGISYRISAESVIIIDERINPVKEFLYSIKMILKETLYEIAPEKEASVLCGIILGDSSEIQKDVKNLYRTSGISHIIAVSGLHISIIGIGIYKLLRRKFYYVISSFISFLFTLSFIIMTGETASGLRALYMFILFLIADILGRTYDSLTAISVSALILLIENPLLIFNTGFLLSFFAIIFIVLLMPVCKEVFPENNKILKAISMSLVAILGTIPVMVNSFYEISTYSILINLIILPFVGIVMTSGLFAAIFGLITIRIGIIIGSSGLFFLKFNEAICMAFSFLPFYTVVVGKMDMFRVLIYYSLLGFVVFIFKKVSKKHLIIICLIILSMIISLVYIKLPGKLEITMIDVGQGEGILIECPDNEAYMIDGGSSSEKELGNYTLVPFLKSKGIGKINYWFVTHGDIDHNSGLIEILDNYKLFNIQINNIVLPETMIKFQEEEDILKLANECGINILKFKRGSCLINDQVIIDCLHPYTGYSSENINGHSMVLSLNYKEFNMLFTGDLEKDGEESLVKSGITKNYDILKVAHHGSKNSTFEEFLSAVKAEIGVVSCGKNNNYGHPNFELINRLDNIGMKIYVTKDSGAIEIKTDGDEYIINGYLDKNGD